jgi:hypothetical protein
VALSSTSLTATIGHIRFTISPYRLRFSGDPAPILLKLDFAGPGYPQWALGGLSVHNRNYGGIERH